MVPRDPMRARTKRAPLAVVVLTAVGLTACGADSTSFESNTSFDDDGNGTILESTSGAAAALTAIESAADSTPFQARFHVRYDFGAELYEIREDVWSDGQGQFAFELVDTLSLTGEYDPWSYPAQYELKAVFNWRHQRLRIRGVGRVLQNYSVIETGATPTVAGVICEQLRLTRNTPLDGRPGVYEVDYDPATALVLGWREYDDTGSAFRSVTAESLELAPDFSNVTLRGQAFPSVDLDLDLPLEPQAGFEVHVPDLLYPGFDIVEIETLEVPSQAFTGTGNTLLPTGNWARVVASDGLEVSLFSHAEGAPQTIPNGLPDASARLQRFAHGDWEVGFGEFKSTAFVATGRMSTSSLYRMVRSAF